MSWTQAGLVEVREAKAGMGVFAVVDIPVDTVIGVFQGVVNRFPFVAGQPDYGDADQHMMLDLYLSGDALYALTLPDRDEPVNRINHSCNPNCHLTGVHGLTVVARRPIAVGDELTFDYRNVTLVGVGQKCWCKHIGPKCRL